MLGIRVGTSELLRRGPPPLSSFMTLLTHDAGIGYKRLQEAMELGMAACKKLHVVMRAALVESESS